MDSKHIDKKIDEVADTAKRVIGKVDETLLAMGDIADAAIANAQSALAQASKKGEHRLTESISKAAHRVEESVTRVAHRAEEWADKAASRARQRQPQDTSSAPASQAEPQGTPSAHVEAPSQEQGTAQGE